MTEVYSINWVQMFSYAASLRAASKCLNDLQQTVCHYFDWCHLRMDQQERSISYWLKGANNGKGPACRVIIFWKPVESPWLLSTRDIWPEMLAGLAVLKRSFGTRWFWAHWVYCACNKNRYGAHLVLGSGMLWYKLRAVLAHFPHCRITRCERFLYHPLQTYALARGNRQLYLSAK